jgi:hypothetical protein
MAVRRQGVWREVWEVCGRCGREYPLSMLHKQHGLLVCADDFDNTAIEKREAMIQSVLANGQESENPKLEKQAVDEDTYDISF